MEDDLNFPDDVASHDCTIKRRCAARHCTIKRRCDVGDVVVKNGCGFRAGVSTCNWGGHDVVIRCSCDHRDGVSSHRSSPTFTFPSSLDVLVETVLRHLIHVDDLVSDDECRFGVGYVRILC